jgi:hypothetical protein
MRDILRSAEEAALARDRASIDEAAGEGENEEAGSLGGSEANEQRPHGWPEEIENEESAAKAREQEKRRELAQTSALHLDVDLHVLSLDEKDSDQVSRSNATLALHPVT